MENNRNNLRRLAGHDEQQFSKDSIVNVMEKFVKSVNAMDETILVPCRLMDKQVGDVTDPIQAKPLTSQQISQQGLKKNKTVHECLNSADLFNLYNMLNALKTDFLWTDNLVEEDDGVKDLPNSQETSSGGLQTNASSSASSATNTKGHNRTPSIASMTSTNSVSNLSDSDSEISNENDSGVESENGSDKSRQNMDKATDLAKQCRKHLSGLYRCLQQMTDAANYLTDRYQNEIGSV